MDNYWYPIHPLSDESIHEIDHPLLDGKHLLAELDDTDCLKSDESNSC